MLKKDHKLLAPNGAEKASKRKIACSEFWEPCWYGIVAGVAFDDEGLHLVQLWPDGEEPRHDFASWGDLKSGINQVLVKVLFNGVTDVWIDTSIAAVSPSRRKRVVSAASEIARLLTVNQYRRVVEFSSGTNGNVSSQDAKARAIEAARQSFESKLQAIKRLNRRSCEQLRRGENAVQQLP